MKKIKFNNLFLLFSFCACYLFLSVANAAIPEIGQNYYTKVGFYFEKGKHVTTNYSRGEFVPANSLVEVKSIKGKKMVLSYKGQDISIQNIEKYSKKNIDEIADRMLSVTPITISGQFAKDISHGEMRLGMTKAEVIMTRGYPPAHKTPDIDYDRWIYWTSRFVKLTLVFENDRLIEGRGLR